MLNYTKTILLHIDTQTSTFSFDDTFVTIPIGYELITSKYLKNTPPTYDEIEYAINYIEDEIEKVVSKLPKYEVNTSDSFIKVVAKLSSSDESELLKDEMERLFGEYAEVSAGRVPNSTQSDLSPLFYAKLLILREYMHHLDIESIKVLKS